MGIFSWLLGRRARKCIFQRTEQSQGNHYDIYAAKSRCEALDFLRGMVIKEERRYVIVETPEGNFGKDLVMLFDERTSAMLELGERRPLPRFKKSMTHCTRCGHSVIPAGRGSDLIVKYYVLLDSMKEKGMGFRCQTCSTIWCAFCVSLEENKAPCAICRESMQPLMEV